MVCILDQTINEEINTQNIEDNNVDVLLYSNPQYRTLKVYVIGYNITSRWKIGYTWETSNKVRSNWHPPYTNGFKSKIQNFNPFLNVDLNQSEIGIFSKVFLLNIDF